MLKNFITAQQARQTSEKIARGLDNAAGIDHIYKLVEATAGLGFNKIVVTLLPEMVDYVREAFPQYRIEEVAYKEPLHPDKVNYLIIW